MKKLFIFFLFLVSLSSYSIDYELKETVSSYGYVMGLGPCTYSTGNYYGKQIKLVMSACYDFDVFIGPSFSVGNYSWSGFDNRGTPVHEYTPTGRSGVLIFNWYNTGAGQSVQIYQAIEGSTNYTLTVNGGTGSGSYPAGTVVQIIADAPLSGDEFKLWSASGCSVGYPDRSETTVTMPANDCSVTATYGNIGEIDNDGLDTDDDVPTLLQIDEHIVGAIEGIELIKGDTTAIKDNTALIYSSMSELISALAVTNSELIKANEKLVQVVENLDSVVETLDEISTKLDSVGTASDTPDMPTPSDYPDLKEQFAPIAVEDMTIEKPSFITGLKTFITPFEPPPPSGEDDFFCLPLSKLHSSFEDIPIPVFSSAFGQFMCPLFRSVIRGFCLLFTLLCSIKILRSFEF